MLHFAEELLLFLLDEQNGTLLPITARTERLAFAGAVLMGAATGAFPISRSRAHTHRRHGHPLQTVPSAGLIERPQEKNRVDALR